MLVEKWLATFLGSHCLLYIAGMQGKMTLKEIEELTAKLGREFPVDFAQIEMIIEIYLPELRPKLDALKQVRTNANAAIRDFVHYTEGRIEYRDTLNRLNRAYDEIQVCGQAIKQGVVDYSQRKS
jgi:hypothetical protein